MTAAMVRAYVLLVAGVVAGIVGMALVFDAVTGGNAAELTLGGPLLLGGLWWSGRELGRSTMAHRARRGHSLPAIAPRPVPNQGKRRRL